MPVLQESFVGANIRKRRRCILTALLMVLFFTSTDTVLFGTNSNFRFLYIPRIVGLLICVLFPVLLNKGRIRIDRRLALCAVLVSLMAVSAIVNHGKFSTTVSRIIPVFVAYSITTYCTLDDFSDVFCEFIYIVSVVALVLEFAAYVVPQVIYVMPSIVNTKGAQFATCFFGALRVSSLSNTLIRSSGIFWEPGAFAVYLNLAIFFQLFVMKHQKTTRLLVYVATLILTFSTAGYICFAFMMMIYTLLFNSKKHGSKLKKIMPVLAFVGVIVVFGSSSIMELVFGKIVNQENTTVVRWLSFAGGFQIAGQAPLWGIFSNGIGDTMKNFSSESGGMLTNTWTYQFAAYGIPFGAMFTIYSYKFFKKLKLNLMLTICMFVFLLLSYAGEMFYSFLPFVFVFYGIGDTNEDSSS